MRCRVICSPRGCAGCPSTEPPRVYTSVGPHHRAPSPAELARRTRHRNVTHRVAGRGRTTRHKPHENRQAERLDLSCSLGQGQGTQDRDTNPSPRRSQRKERPSFMRHRGPDGHRSVNKAIGALWTPMKARDLCHLRAWRGRLWAGGAAAEGMGASGGGGVWKGPGCEAGTCRAMPAGSRRRPRCDAMLPPRAPQGYCCPTALASWNLSTRSFPPSTGQLSGSCKDTAQPEVQTPNSKRGGDPVVTSCPHRDARSPRAQGDRSGLLRSRGNAGPCRHGGTVWRLLAKLNAALSCDPTIPFQDVIPKNWNQGLKHTRARACPSSSGQRRKRWLRGCPAALCAHGERHAAVRRRRSHAPRRG